MNTPKSVLELGRKSGAKKSNAAVFIMVDEPHMKRSLRQFLERGGYRVIEQFRPNGISNQAPALLGSSASPHRLAARKPVALVAVARPNCAASQNAPSVTTGERSAANFLQWGPLFIDFADQMVRVAGERIRLTVTEFSVLKAVAEGAGKLVTQSEIIRRIWGQIDARSRASLRVCLCSVRKKLRRASVPELVLTEPGMGYRLSAL